MPPKKNVTSRQTSEPPKTPPRGKTPQTAILVTPPGPNLRAFRYKKTESHSKGYTPNKRHVLDLREHEGSAHVYVGPKDRHEELVHTDAMPESPYKKNYEKCHLTLLAKLKGLKGRADSDYKFKISDGEIDLGHYKAMAVMLSQCIVLMRKCYTLSPNPNLFLEDLNQKIAQDKILYNPFSLETIYGSQNSEYNLELAQKISFYCAPIKKDSVAPRSFLVQSRGSLVSPVPKKLVSETPGRCFGLYDNLGALAPILPQIYVDPEESDDKSQCDDTGARRLSF